MRTEPIPLCLCIKFQDLQKIMTRDLSILADNLLCASNSFKIKTSFHSDISINLKKTRSLSYEKRHRV